MNYLAHNAGFSLVEVMVAILILGIALAGLTTGITTALGSSKESEQQTTAALFAAGQIETLRAEGGLVDGEKNGVCGAGDAPYRWKQTISPTTIEGLHEVDVVVENSGDGRLILDLKTMLFEPVADPATVRENARNKKKRSADR